MTRGKRSPVTCHLKCADACSHPVPNVSSNETFRDIAAAALSRRAALGVAGAGALTLVAGPSLLAGTAAAAPAPAVPEIPIPAGGLAIPEGGDPILGKATDRNLPFTAIGPVAADQDTFTVPKGYKSQPIIRWGDPILPGAPAFDGTKQTAAAQACQFGYNNDYLDIIPITSTSALLVCNHEYTNENIMFPVAATPAEADEQKRIGMNAHGFSVVELTRTGPGKPWTYKPTGKLNRRFITSTPFAVTGPAAGSDMLKTAADPTGKKVLGTLGNCAGGTTPWGTVLSGEENFNGYFRAAGTTDSEKRYGLTDRATSRNWESLEPRFDARSADYANEPNRYGWIVEIDPFDPTSTPRKHTAMGRLKHEGANVQVAPDGRVVAYMGDDERFDYLYKFVSKNKMRPLTSLANRKHNMTLLTEGDLYVARFIGDSPAAQIDGTGTLPADGVFDGLGVWLPLVLAGTSQIPGMTVPEVLVHTRLAADKAGATKMDRCEDVQSSPKTGKVYVACTNNTDRGKVDKEGPTEVNPRNANRDGHIVELTEGLTGDADPLATTFRWNLLLVCGDPAEPHTYFGGYPKDKVSPISCPDNVAFDSDGNLWISTDGAPSTLNQNDGLFKVPLVGKERGRVQQFLAVPTEAETCGPVIHDRDGSVFVAVQHPGEDGSFAEQHSFWPDFVPAGTVAPKGQFAGPRPSVVQVYRG
ncbi:PhoX family protein [Nakamurella alba]|nr:PhoX family phosphatase [Nakamurella alba]